jgi:exodeoxyribonuclease-5
MSKIIPTLSQQTVLQQLLDFMQDNEEYICLIGPPGCGKSSVIQCLVDLLPSHTKICFTSPTNKATKVLKNMSLKHNIDVECRTIHSLLGLQIKVDNQGKESLQFSGNSSFGKFDLVVCDEMSMVNQELFDYINKDVMFSSSAKFIFMGDRNQLNPVNETESPAFKLRNKIYLTEVIRQKLGNPILDLCSDIRINLESKQYKLPKIENKTNENGTVGIHLMNSDEILNVISHTFTDERFNNNPDMFRVIAWRNVTVDYFNTLIQKIRYPKLTTPFAVGEHLVFSKPLHHVSTNINFSYNSDRTYDGWDKVVCSTESEATVESLTEITPFIFEPTTYQLNKGYNFVPIIVRRLLVKVRFPDNTRQSFTIASDKNELQNLYRFISNCIKTNSYEISWRTFYTIQKCFAEVRPLYCITSHKSQASTFENVFCIANDIMMNKNKEEALRSFYVACSRASENLIIQL